MPKIIAVGMLSGGLDSTLAAAMIKRQGVEVRGVNFSTGFCLDDHKRAGVRNDDKDKPRRHEALRCGADLDIPVEIIDVSQEYGPVVTNPKYGYGSAINPCIDCRIFMFKRAKAYMEDIGAHFVFTGEVLGQRPMSQHRQAMDNIARDSGLEGYIVRPLCAKHLPETEPEKRGWLNREELGDMNGRSRKQQNELAAKWNIEDFPQPAGGCCYLIDENFARKLLDMWKQKGEKTYTPDEALLLKVGRHLRLSPQLKIIVGRDEGENQFLARFSKSMTTLSVHDGRGGTVLLYGEPENGELELAAAIAAFYSQHRKEEQVEVTVQRSGEVTLNLKVTPAKLAYLDKLRI